MKFTLKKTFNLLFSTLFIVFAAFPSFASEDKHEEEEFDVSKMIMHHVKDAHEWHLWGGHHNSTSIYLPIILMDGGLKVFSSSHFYHGEMVKEKVVTIDSAKNETVTLDVEYVKGVGPAAGYAMCHEKIYKLDEAGKLHFEAGSDHPHNAKPMDFSITKNVVFLFITSLLVILVMFKTASFYRKNGAIAPKGLAKFIEPLVVFVRDDIAIEHIGEHKYKRYLPYLLTIFFFILFANLLGSVPLVGANLSGNISVTLFLAVCTLLLTVISGNGGYWKHIFWPPGVPIALMPIMIPLEIIGIFTKPFALMIRLFANITAGHIIVLALISIIFVNRNLGWAGLSVPMTLFISVLELLVAFLQAYLFALLSALFIGAAVVEHHHEHEHEGANAHH